MIADVLAPSWHQSISNDHYDVGWSTNESPSIKPRRVDGVALWCRMSFTEPPSLQSYDLRLHRLYSRVISHVWQTYFSSPFAIHHGCLITGVTYRTQVPGSWQHRCCSMTTSHAAVWAVPRKVYCAVITDKHDEIIIFFNKIYEPAVQNLTSVSAAESMSW